MSKFQSGSSSTLPVIIIAIILGIIIIVIPILFFTGVFPGIGVGELVSQDREVSNISKIKLKTSGDLYLTQSTKESLEIEAPENIIDEITSNVENGTLVIDSDRDGFAIFPFGALDERIYNVSVKDLDEITIEGSGNIYSELFQTDSLKINIDGSGFVDMYLESKELETYVDGSGNLDLTGKTGSQKIDIAGSGNYKAFNFDSQKTDVIIDGSGNVDASVSERLDVEISGSGKIRYKGSPVINQNISGGGSITQLRD